MSERAEHEQPCTCGCSREVDESDDLAAFAELVSTAAAVLEWTATNAALTGVARAVAVVASLAAMFLRRSR